MSATPSLARLVALLLLLSGPAGADAGGAAGLAVESVARVPQATVLAFDASIEARRQSRIDAQVAGRVEFLAVRAGDVVQAGALIARLDERELGAAEAAHAAAVREAEANLHKAEVDLRRSRALAAQHFLSPAAVEQGEAQQAALRARVAALRAERQASALSRGHAQVRAPYAGVVAATHVEEGDTAVPGRPLVTIFQAAAMRAVAQVAERHVAAARAALNAGQWQVEVQGRQVAVLSAELLPVADPATRTTELRLALAADTALAPGQFARVALTQPGVARLSVAEAAVLRRGELVAVYVRATDGALQLRQVRLGQSLAGGRVEVLAGLRVGERVVLEPVKAGMLAARGAAAH